MTKRPVTQADLDNAKPGDIFYVPDGEATEIRTIKYRNNSGLFTKEYGHIHDYFALRHWFIDSSPLEDAKRTLEEAGYTVTPSPEPMKGKVVIYKVDERADGKTYCKSWEEWERYCSISLSWRPYRTIVAIVDWEEGQGL